MDEALAGNQTVAAADAALQRARAQTESVAGGLKPQVDANAAAERARINTAAFGFAGFPSPTINLYSVGGTVAYDLDLFGGGRRRVEAAAARAEGEGRRADAAYLTLTGNVAMRAAQIAAVRAELGAVQAIIADDQHNIDIVRRAEAAGGEAPAATIGGRSQLAQDEALLPPLQQQLAEARHALALLVGRSPADWSAPDFDLAGLTAPPEIPVSLPSALVRRRPDILAAEADLHAATARRPDPDRPVARQAVLLRRQRLEPGRGPDRADLPWRLAQGRQARGGGGGKGIPGEVPADGARGLRPGLGRHGRPGQR